MGLVLLVAAEIKGSLGWAVPTSQGDWELPLWLFLIAELPHSFTSLLCFAEKHKMP